MFARRSQTKYMIGLAIGLYVQGVLGQMAQFSPSEIASRRFVEIKNKEWTACRQNKNLRILQVADDLDDVSLFLGNQAPIDDLTQMDAQKLMAGQAQKPPWSGDYWAYARGILANRYRSPEFSALYSWSARYDYVKKNPAPLILSKQGQPAVATLSPAEKYDFLVGDQKMAFTSAMWAEGKKYNDSTGSVEDWMGICHGWAPAAIVEPRPEKSIDVVSYDKQWAIHLLPSELKGLVSYSWAYNSFPTVSLGQRCNKKDPKRDANGRLIDPECFDLNPATWHLAVVNELGRGGKSFVMDATYDYEVWNQPVLNYSYSYFNVKTEQPVIGLQQAITSKAEYANDKYKKYRSPDAQFFVGISMKIGYVVETPADESEVDAPESDYTRWVQYDYDLELNAAGKIIGGEWHQSIHPDFIWTPQPSARPQSPYDSRLSPQDWVGASDPIPESWAKSAQWGSKNGYILNTITGALLQRAKN